MSTKKPGKKARQSLNPPQADASNSTPRLPAINQQEGTHCSVGLVSHIIASATPYAIERARSRAAQRKRYWTATASVPPPPTAILKLQSPLETVALEAPTFPQSNPSSAFQALIIDGIELREVYERPCWKSINIEMPAAIDKNLTLLPLGYVKYELEREGHALLNSLRHAKVLLSQGCRQIGKEIEVAFDPWGPDLPTHALAVVASERHTVSRDSSAGSSSEARRTHRVSIHLIHDIILATHCALLPAISLVPKPACSTSASKHRTLKLPVIALALPHPPSFPILQLYLYTKCGEELVTTLLPIPPAMIGLTPNSQRLSTVDLTRYLLKKSTFDDLYKTADLVRGVWANAVGLGVWEPDLWSAIEFCWEVVYEALRLAIRHQRRS